METTPSRETLHHWPTEPIQDAVEWWMYYAAPDYVGIPGRFRYDDLGRIVFECEDGTALGSGTFEDGERFEPIEATGDATITFPPPPEPTYFGDVIPNGRARIASLEAEVSSLRERLTLGESAVTVIANDLGNIRQSLGARDGELTVDAAARVGEDLVTLRAQLAAPLRLGRGPTGDEVKQHGVGVGLWLVHFAGDAPDRWHVVCFRAIDDEDARPTDFEIDEVGWTDIAVDYDDAIPLSRDRQPCRVGGTKEKM